jgi:hypothetical protein
MKDKSYRTSFVGGEVGRFLRSMRWSEKTQNSLDTYEIVLPVCRSTSRTTPTSTSSRPRTYATSSTSTGATRLLRLAFADLAEDLRLELADALGQMQVVRSPSQSQAD